MPSARIQVACAALACVALAGPARAAGVALTHAASVYADAKEGPLRAPEGVACTEGGRFVVADTGNGRLLTYAFKDGKVSGGTELKLAQLARPTRVQLDRAGNVLALDGKTRRIVRLDEKGGFGGFVEPKGGASAIVPVAFAVDGADNVHVLDSAGRRVIVLDASGAVTRELALPSKVRSSFTDLAVSPSGALYAVEGVNAVVWTAEKGATELRPLTASMKDRMSFPASLSMWQGKLFVVDQNGSGVVVLGPDGSYLGRQLSIGWSDGLVNYPAQLCIDAAGDAIVADRFNNRVQIFDVVQ